MRNRKYAEISKDIFQKIRKRLNHRIATLDIGGTHEPSIYNSICQ